MNENIMKFFANMIEQELGIVYHEANWFQLQHRLEQITNQMGLENLDAFFKKAQSGLTPVEKGFLLDIATNNETSFFRDASVYRAFSGFVLPEIIKENSSGSKIRLWSAASSSGQEVYSILMEYDQYKKQNPNTPDLGLDATDVSTAILARAETGEYSQLEIQRGLPAKLLIEYFDKTEAERWKIKDFLKRELKFRKLNLLDELYGLGPYDIVFCRNVLIYQSIENKRSILKRIHGVMKPRGFLFLGAAESLIGLSSDFDQIESNGAILFRKK